MSFDFEKWLDNPKPIRLKKGVGNPETGGCWMSALSMYSGDRWTDHPDCVCQAIASFCIAINDGLPSDEARGRVIGPRLLDPLGTKGDLELFNRRNTIAMEMAKEAVRRYVRIFLELYKNPASLAFFIENLEKNPYQCLVMIRGLLPTDALKEKFILDEYLPILDAMLAVGNRTPVEMSCDVASLNKCVQRVDEIAVPA